jgi:membrane protease YdiL (CAAX protease family)
MDDRIALAVRLDSSGRISCTMPAPALKPGLGSSPNALLFWVVGVGAGFTAIRAFAMLGPVAARPLFLAHCIVMAITPWLLLTAAGRAQSGIRRPDRQLSLVIAPFAGVTASVLCFLLGYALFERTADNWFVSVGNSFRAQPTPGFSTIQLHLMFTIPAMIFSPIGEEIYFRGVLQRALETRFSSRISAALESGWFGAAHLVHHGLFLTAAGLSFRPVSGILWFLLTTLLSLVFVTLRKFGNSVFPAVIAHSAFNATMNFFIFGYLWNDAA